jgi:hypothetical protein
LYIHLINVIDLWYFWIISRIHITKHCCYYDLYFVCKIHLGENIRKMKFCFRVSNIFVKVYFIFISRVSLIKKKQQGITMPYVLNNTNFVITEQVHKLLKKNKLFQYICLKPYKTYKKTVIILYNISRFW